MKKYPLLVMYKGRELFFIKSNGDIVLENLTIGNNKQLAKIFTEQGKVMEKVIKNMEELTKNLNKESKQ